MIIVGVCFVGLIASVLANVSLPREGDSSISSPDSETVEQSTVQKQEPDSETATVEIVGDTIDELMPEIKSDSFVTKLMTFGSCTS